MNFADPAQWLLLWVWENMLYGGTIQWQMKQRMECYGWRSGQTA